MNLISPGGLLWFDDDNRRPIQQKIAEAAQRYRERVGFEPTICQLNPAQATALEASVSQATTRTKRAPALPAPTLPATLRLVPSTLIQPHCYLIGIAEGDQPRAAVLPYRDDDGGKTTGAARKSGSTRATAGTGQAAAQRASAASRRAPSRSERVHAAVQPALFDAAISEAKRRTRLLCVLRVGARRVPHPGHRPLRHPGHRPAASVTARPVGASLSTSKAPTSATPSPRAKPAKATVPTSLLAAAPVSPTNAARGTRRARSAKLAGISTPTLPLPEIVAEIAAQQEGKKGREAASRRSTKEKAIAARQQARSHDRTTKRSA